MQCEEFLEKVYMQSEEDYGDSMPHMEYITRSNHVADALGLLAIMEDSDVES